MCVEASSAANNSMQRPLDGQENLTTFIQLELHVGKHRSVDDETFPRVHKDSQIPCIVDSVTA